MSPLNRDVHPIATMIQNAYKAYTDKDIDSDDEIVFHCFFLDYCMCHRRQRENFVLYEKDLYNSLCFNNLMINDEYFHIQRQVECDYSDYYNKYTVDIFNGNNQIIHRRDSFDPMFKPYMNSYRNTGMHKNIMIDILNNLKPDEYDEYLQPDHGYLRIEDVYCF